MIAVCQRCQTFTHHAPNTVNPLAYLCHHCSQTPDLPLFNQPKSAKPKRKAKRQRHPAEGGPDPTKPES